jgi:hypothetical protein
MVRGRWRGNEKKRREKIRENRREAKLIYTEGERGERKVDCEWQ